MERYYEAHASELAAEHSLETNRTNSYVDSVVAAITAFWHIGRLGILGVSFAEFLQPNSEEETKQKTEATRKIANWLAGLMNANPGAMRPLLDLHHIELFLMWRTFWQTGRRDDIYKWLHALRNCLLVRRAGTIPLPFIEGHSSLDLVFEFVATGERPPEFCDQSSLLVLLILELCFSLADAQRDELIASYYEQIVLGRDSNGERLKNSKPLDLMGWGPPVDWGQKLLTKSLADEGESQTLETFDTPLKADGPAIAAKLQEFICQCRRAREQTFPDGLPLSVIVLACLKHRSPLPPELWRLSIFGPLATEKSE